MKKNFRHLCILQTHLLACIVFNWKSIFVVWHFHCVCRMILYSSDCVFYVLNHSITFRTYIRGQRILGCVQNHRTTRCKRIQAWHHPCVSRFRRCWWSFPSTGRLYCYCCMYVVVICSFLDVCMCMCCFLEYLRLSTYVLTFCWSYMAVRARTLK